MYNSDSDEGRPQPESLLLAEIASSIKHLRELLHEGCCLVDGGKGREADVVFARYTKQKYQLPTLFAKLKGSPIIEQSARYKVLYYEAARGLGKDFLDEDYIPPEDVEAE